MRKLHANENTNLNFEQNKNNIPRYYVDVNNYYPLITFNVQKVKKIT